MDEHGIIGPDVTTFEGLFCYTGVHGEQCIEGHDRREAVKLNRRQLEINYGQNVEFQLRERQVLLSPQTRDFLYSHFTPLSSGYVPGSRPILEAHVQEIISACRNAEDRALALMRFCRDLYQRGHQDTDHYIYGGTEEQLIEKGEELCECLGRLYVGLCEIAGIPGRLVMHDIGGHIAAEAYIDGVWGYIDPRCGIYARAPDGHLASTWELWEHPEWLRRQCEDVKRDVSPRWTWEERLMACERKYFHRREVNAFENYSLAHASRYSYAQISRTEATSRGLFVINKTYRSLANHIFGLEC